MIRVGVLGPLVVTDDGEGAARRVDVGDRRRRSLLAMLVLGRGAVVSTGALVEGLWPSRPPAAPVAALQAHVSHVRRSFQPEVAPRARTTVIRRVPPGYRCSCRTTPWTRGASRTS